MPHDTFTLDGFAVGRLGPDDAPEVQGLWERCADFHELQEGTPPRATIGAEELAALPPGRTQDDKHAFAVRAPDGTTVGFVDLVQGYPRDDEWWLGLLMLDPAWRSRGPGGHLPRGLDLGAVARSGGHRPRGAGAESRSGAVLDAARVRGDATEGLDVGPRPHPARHPRAPRPLDGGGAVARSAGGMKRSGPPGAIRVVRGRCFGHSRQRRRRSPRPPWPRAPSRYAVVVRVSSPSPCRCRPRWSARRRGCGSRSGYTCRAPGPRCGPCSCCA